MNHSPIQILHVNGKTIRPEDLPPEAWNIVLGKTEDTDLQDLVVTASPGRYSGTGSQANGPELSFRR